MKRIILVLLALCISLTVQPLLQAGNIFVNTQEPYVWKVGVRQSGCNAQVEGWFLFDATKASEEFGYPVDLVCYESSAEQYVDDWYIVPPNGVVYWIRFDWEPDGVWDEIIFNEYISFTGDYWSKSYSHSPFVEIFGIRVSGGVGGYLGLVDKASLLVPFISVASTTLIAIVASAIYIRRAKHRKENREAPF